MQKITKRVVGRFFVALVLSLGGLVAVVISLNFIVPKLIPMDEHPERTLNLRILANAQTSLQARGAFDDQVRSLLDLARSKGLVVTEAPAEDGKNVVIVDGSQTIAFSAQLAGQE